MAYIDLFIVQQHTVDGFDGCFCSLGGLVVNETVTLGTTVLVGCNFAGQYVAESSERIVKSLNPRVSYHEKSNLAHNTCLVVNLLVKVLNEDVALPGLAEGGVSLRPHDAAAEDERLDHCTYNESLTKHDP